MTGTPIPPDVSSEHEVEIEDMAFKGEAIARVDGEVIFVPAAIPGERVRIAIRKQKKGYAIAEVLEVLEASPHRITPPCPYFGPCSGCTWQHVAYPEQLRLKQHVVAEQMRRIGKLDSIEVLPTLGMENPWHYRNHMRFTVSREGRAGFVQRGSHRFVQINRCLIADERANEILGHFQERGVPSTALNIRLGVRTGEELIQPRIDDEAVETGQPDYHEELLGTRFRIGAPSFFQVNTTQAEVLVQTVLDQLQLTGDEVLADVYAGVGTFSALLAPHVRSVYYIEESGPAYRNAIENLAPFPNVMLIQGKAEEQFAKLPEPADVVVLDPPRAGCHPALTEALIEMRPATIAYVSCDPSTLARDLGLLHEAGYAIGPVQPVDMFPQTYHIESVVVLRAQGPAV